MLLHQKMPLVCENPRLAKRSLREAKGPFTHTAEQNSADIACLKKAGETEQSVRELLASARFTQAEADAAVAPHYPAPEPPAQ